MDTGDDTPLSDVPPAPLLVYRSSSVLVFKAATFKPKSGEKVCFFFLAINQRRAQLPRFASNSDMSFPY